MKKLSFTDFIVAAIIMIAVISISVVIVLNSTFIYNIVAKELDIESTSGYSYETIIENYNILIDYNILYGSEELEFNGFDMSEEGEIHFQEVKEIFVAFQIITIILLPLSILLAIIKIKKKNTAFLRLSCILTIVVPVFVGICISLNWEWFFVTFHELAFDNDYWIFNETTDPIIKILPEEIFMVSAVIIALIIMIIDCIIYGIYRRLNKKYSINLT